MMTTRYNEAVDTLAALKLAERRAIAQCQCLSHDTREDCPAYAAFTAAGTAADAYLARIRDVFPAAEARAIELRAESLAMTTA
jgi:transposase